MSFREDSVLFKVYLAFIVLFIASLALAGGSSRDDVITYIAIEIASFFVLCLFYVGSGSQGVRAAGLPLAFLGALAALMLVQLVPLAPQLWTELPGREFYAQAAQVAGVPQPWRPISLSPDRTVDSLLGLLPIFATALIVGSGPRRFTNWVMITVLVLAVVSVVLAVFQLSAGPDTDLRFYRFTNTDAGVGLLANRNHQALFLAMAIPVATWWTLTPGARVAAPAARLALGVSMIGLFLVGGILTGSRSGLLAASVAILASVGLAWPAVKRLPVLVKALAGGALAAAGTGLVFLVLSGHRILSQSVQEDDRSSFWPRTVELIREFFPFGSGVGSFDRVFPRVEHLADLGPEYVNRAHNDFLEMGLEAGLFAYLLLAAFLAWWIMLSIRAWRSHPRAASDVGLARLASVIIALGLLGSVTDYPLRTPLLGSVFCAACVVLHRRSQAPVGEALSPRG